MSWTVLCCELRNIVLCWAGLGSTALCLFCVLRHVLAVCCAVLCCPTSLLYVVLCCAVLHAYYHSLQPKPFKLQEGDYAVLSCSQSVLSDCFRCTWL